MSTMYYGFGVALDCSFVVALLEETVALLLPIHGRANGILVLLVFLFGADWTLLGLPFVCASECGPGLILPLLFYH